MNTDKYRIVNGFDRPCEELIAELREDGRLYYVHPKLATCKSYAKGMNASESTPVEYFGVTLKESENGALIGEVERASVATYHDGRPRSWQGGTLFSFKMIRKSEVTP